MVPPLGDSRAGQARAQVPIVILLVLAAVAVDLLTMSQFPENLSVLLPALTLIMATPHLCYSMAKATCTSLSFLIPPIWTSIAKLKKGDSALLAPDSPPIVWLLACQTWGILNVTHYSAAVMLLMVQYLVWLSYKAITTLAAGTTISARHVFSVLTFVLGLVYGVAYILTIMPISQRT